MGSVIIKVLDKLPDINLVGNLGILDYLHINIVKLHKVAILHNKEVILLIIEFSLFSFIKMLGVIIGTLVLINLVVGYNLDYYCFRVKNMTSQKYK